MQFLKLSAIFFASVAIAEHRHGVLHFHHHRQMNSTNNDISTTLIVYQTVVHTITSCAPTITDCPARSSAGAGIITDVIVLTTTVCPVSVAESVASSIISAAGGSSSAFTGRSMSPTVNTPLGTSFAAVGTSKGSAASGGAEGPSSSDTVLTYTLGTGSSTTVVTTTLKSTSTATAYITQYVTRPTSTGAMATVGASAQSAVSSIQIGASGTHAASTVGASQGEPTTTTTSSSTMTKYITVMVAPSRSGIPTNGVAGGSSAGGSGNCNCAAVAPVTVTVALATVTVTYSQMAASPTAKTSPATSADVIKIGAASSSNTSPATTAAIISSLAATSITISSSAPYGNRTRTETKPCYGSGSSFLTLVKPTGTTSADY